MNTNVTKPFFALTAVDLMSRKVVSIALWNSLLDAAKQLAEHSIHGAPVVDGEGRCVGVLSITDLARWMINRHSPNAPLPQTCQFQEKLREIGGETILCRLALGTCPFQQQHLKSDGTKVVACGSPHSVPVDWQVVEYEPLPNEEVKHYMTSGPATASPSTPIIDLAQLMAHGGIQRIVIVDDEKRPIGIVSSSDIVGAVAVANPPKGSNDDEPKPAPLQTRQ